MPALRSRLPGKLRALGAAVLALGLVGSAELAARALGVLDFPLYRLDPEMIYVISPSQRGTFFGGKAWDYNEYGMGGGPLEPGDRNGILLVGDSVVAGGFTLDGRDKIDARLAERLSRKVWSIGTGGWAFLNELAYLKRHRDLLPTFGTVVFVINSADFQGYGPWNASGYPLARPASALAFIAQRKLFGDGPPDTGIYSPTLTPEMESGWRDILAAFDGRVLIAKHSRAPELGSSHPGLDAVVGELVRLSGGRAEVVEVARDPRWGAHLYKDSVHITPDGNAVIAAILADALASRVPIPRRTADQDGAAPARGQASR
jgi:hypothetical protein